VGYIVGQITATDRDPGVNGIVSYYLTGGNDNSTFSIDSTLGVITIAKPLDYEQQRRYDLIMLARDSAPIPQQTQQNFTVMVTDANDNPPVFYRDTYTTFISEGAVIGSTVIEQINASDADRGSNAVVQYYISGGNGSSTFLIDQFTGVFTSCIEAELQRCDCLHADSAGC